jgi:hypothetical protein
MSQVPFVVAVLRHIPKALRRCRLFEPFPDETEAPPVKEQNSIVSKLSFFGRERRARFQSFAGEHRPLESERIRQEQFMTATAWDSAAKTTVEDSASETLGRRLCVHVQALATRRLPITYQDAAKGMFLSPPNTIHQVTEALQQLMGEDAAADRPFIAAMVISKARGGLPAPGFFDCAARLGRFAGDATGLDAWSFHAAEFYAAVVLWEPPSGLPRE